MLEAGAGAAAGSTGHWFTRLGRTGSDGCTTGVYVGIGSHEYHDYILIPHGLSVHALVAPGNAMSTASGRASFMFGLSGGGAFHSSTSHLNLSRFCH